MTTHQSIPHHVVILGAGRSPLEEAGSPPRRVGRGRGPPLSRVAGGVLHQRQCHRHVAAYEQKIGQAAYAASNGGLVATFPVAWAFAQLGTRAITITPGIFWTPIRAGLPQDAQGSLGKQVSLPSRLGRTDGYAPLAGGIIANPILNGETIRLDGPVWMAPR